MKTTIYLSNLENKITNLGEFEMEYKNRDFCEEQNHPGDVEGCLINIHDSVEYQTYGGIGGAFTESTQKALSEMSKDKQEEVFKAYFDKKDGIGYNFGRLSINSCDFSVEDYTYVKEGDTTLDSFDISHDDEIFKNVKQASKYNDITLFASPWSPPAYMKNSGSRIGGHLKKEFYGLWAKYVAKYVDACKERGLNIWAVTMQNEPRHHQTWESCLYSTEEENELLGYLGKELQPKGVKILCYDHCRERAFERIDYMKQGKNGKYLDGVAHHWYSGPHFGELRAVYSKYPEAINVASESCVGVGKEGISEDSNLSTAEKFAFDVIGSFNNGLNFYCDWNLVLDEKNGPYHNRENRGAWVDALVYCDKTKNEVIYRLGYYYMGHISKFVEKGAKIVSSSSYTEDLTCCAFKNPDGKIVLVVLNRKDYSQYFIPRVDNCVHGVNIPAHSIITFVIEK